VLDPRVEILGVLAKNDEVDVLVGRRDPREGAHGTETDVEIERLAEVTFAER
jgi:hypothetical protein